MNTVRTDLVKYRKKTIEDLKTLEFDILVVGGGITGAGIARDAILRGYSVALVEKNDFASGTSSGSSKLVHAGLRYIAQKKFRLVREASIERKKILEMAPHLTRPLKFLVPLHSDTRTTKRKMRLAIWLYDLLAGFRNYTFHKIIPPGKARSLLPQPLKEENFQGAALYGDGQMDDARLTLDIILSAEEHGAIVLNYCEVISFDKQGSGNIKTINVIDKLEDFQFKIKTRFIVLACGHWTDKIVHKIDPTFLTQIRPTKGIHLITRRFYQKEYAVVVPVQDGRIIFLVPFGEYLLIGTTDTDYSDDYDMVPVLEEEVEYLIESINFIFPGALKKEDIFSAYSGLRPLILSPNAKSESDVSRDHKIFVTSDNIYAIAGGKYTTYRVMAKELIDRLSKHMGKKGKCITDKVPLFGWMSTKRKYWDNWVIVALENMAVRYQLAEDIARHLIMYGKNYQKICKIIELNPHLKERISEIRPYIYAEIDYFIKYEKAISLKDIMLRRTKIQLSNEQGKDCLKKIADHMAKLLNWSEEKREDEITSYIQSLVWNP